MYKSQRPRPQSACTTCTRRSLLVGAFVLAVPAPITAATDALPAATSELAKLRPQPTDRLVYANGLQAGQLVAPDQLAIASPPVTAWPMAADTLTIRNGSHLNQVNLLRFEPGVLSPRTLESAADGIVAYASMCTHAGCDVNGFNIQTHHLVCPCHGSEFDVLDAAAVAKGPATKPLAMLPLKIEDGALVVTRGFTHQVGFKPL